MTRFFTKKSVAFIVTTMVLFGVFCFSNITKAAENNCDKTGLRHSVKAGETDKTTIDEVQLYNDIQEAHDIICAAQNEKRPLISSELDRINFLKKEANDLNNGINNEAKRRTNNTNFLEKIANSVDLITNAALNTVTGVVSGFLEYFIIPISATLTALAGSILDYAVRYTIYGDGFSAMKDSIQTVWVLLRDTANITFIFLLLYAAIRQILSGAVEKKLMVSVIISAILINFSLFTTRIIVDASNILTNAIYSQIVIAPAATNAGQTAVNYVLTPITGGSNVDLSGHIMDALKLNTVFDVSNAKDNGKSLTGWQGMFNSFSRLVLYIITTWMFTMLAVIIIGRFIMLVILMAASPVGFVGITIPGLGNMSAIWRKTLIDQCLLAPMLMFLLLLTIRLSKGFGTFDPGSIAAYFNYFFILFLIFKSVELIKKLSGPIGEWADKAAKVAQGLALTAVTGGTAAALSAGSALTRQTVGRSANALANSVTGKRLEAIGARGGIIGGLAKIGSTTIKGAAKSTFDVRNTGVGKEAISKISIPGGIPGEFTKGGGTYGKEGKGTGFAGLKETQREQAVEKATKMETAQKEISEKTAGEIEYQKKIVENLEADLRNNPGNPQIMNDLNIAQGKLAEAKKKDLKSVVESDQQFKSIIDRVKKAEDTKNQMQKEADIEREDKMDELKREVQKYNEQRKDVRERLANGTITPAQHDYEMQQIAENEAQLKQKIRTETDKIKADLERDQKTLDQWIKDQERAKEVATKNIEQKIAGSSGYSGTLKAQMSYKQAKQNLVDKFRKGFNPLKGRFTGKHEETARKIEGAGK
jgi:hypothetical protein